MEVVRARTAGFCMGVSLAIQKLDTALENANSHIEKSDKPTPNQNAKLYTLGPIIHNPQLVSSYQEKGAVCIETEEMGRAVESGTVVIRAHGVPFELENILIERGLNIVDATCPKVKAAQLAIKKATDNGRSLLLFGEKDHPEVLSLLSYTTPDAIVFASIEELEGITIDHDKKYVLASQTTQDNEIFNLIINKLSISLSHPPRILKTICMATKNRQKEVLSIAEQCNSMVIVGGKNSGNTRRLAEISRAKGLFTVHCEVASEIPLEELKNKQPIGLSAGASTPFFLIDEAEQLLKKY